MKKKILLPLFILLSYTLHAFATPVTLNLFEGGLSLLDSLVLIAAALVIIGILFICIALFKPMPKPKTLEDTASDDVVDSFDDEDDEDEYDDEDDSEDTDETDDDSDLVEDIEETVEDETSDIEDEIAEDETPVSEDPVEDADDADETETQEPSEEIPAPTPEIIYPKLTLVDTKSHDFKILPLSGKTSIGRKITNDLVLTDNTVSGLHCVILTQDDVIYIQDMDSTNGTFLNGTRIHEMTKLERGDKLAIGKQEFIINL